MQSILIVETFLFQSLHNEPKITMTLLEETRLCNCQTLATDVWACHKALSWSLTWKKIYPDSQKI